MGLAGFNRARRRHDEDGVGLLATAPLPKPQGKNYVKQDITEKHYCAYCDKHFNNISAYNKHMMYKHLEDFVANNPNAELPPILQEKLKNKET